MVVSAFVLRRVSKAVLSVVIPGCGLPVRVFLRIVCHVSWSVLTSWSCSPFICRWIGGVGGPLRIAWKLTFLRKPCERKRLVTMHSWTMSSLPASCMLVQFVSVLPVRL